jgi:hypothetical protein
MNSGQRIDPIVTVTDAPAVLFIDLFFLPQSVRSDPPGTSRIFMTKTLT